MHSSWEHLADEILFKPLDMADTSYRHADYQEPPNRALIHVPAGNRTWVAKYNRDADPEAPAGDASSSVRDLARWLRLQLAKGSYDGPALNPSGRTATDWPGNLHTRRRSFRINLCGTATSVRLGFYDETGLGTFTRG
jgi:CubicO group peptidase (beta-lactamase class C family)